MTFALRIPGYRSSECQIHSTSLRRGISSQIFIRGQMDNVAKISAEAVPSMADNVMVNAMAVICGLALVVFACMATSGLDMSAGFC